MLPLFNILLSYSNFAVNSITLKQKSPQHFKIQWEPEDWLYPGQSLIQQSVWLIARRYHRRLKPRNVSQAQIRAEVWWNMALSRGLRCCQRIFSWIPVLIITSVVLWSYYAYVFELCLCKYNKPLKSFLCDCWPFNCGDRRLPHSSVDK